MAEIMRLLDGVPSWLKLLVVVLGAGVGALFGSFLKTYGKDLATRAQADDILKRVESIKADVAGQLWVGQEKWKFKADLYKRLLGDLAVLYETCQRHDHVRKRAEAMAGCSDQVQAHTELVSQCQELKRQVEKDLMPAVLRSRAEAEAFLGQRAKDVLEALDKAWNQAAERSLGSAGVLPIVEEAIQGLAEEAGEDLKLSVRESI